MRMSVDNFGTWLEIDLGVLAHNYRVITETAGTAVMPVIKANAYGHGLEKVAKSLEKAGAQWFDVARIEEALLLREIGIKNNILVLGYTSPSRVPHAIKEDIRLTVYDREVADAYIRQAERLSEKLSLHVKVDSGMGRLGVLMSEAHSFVVDIARCPHLVLEGLFTHFACADEPEKPATQSQIKRFDQLIGQLASVEIQPPLLHAANSAGALTAPESRLNMVRVGIALFGLPPSQSVQLPAGIRPCLSWKTRLISLKTLPPGHGVSYGFRYITSKNERIGVIAAGYGDGLRWQKDNQVLLRGKKANVVGSVCMDQCMLQLDDIPEARIGDEVVLIGQQGSQEITATEIAEKWETINYEVICGLASRMPRYYKNSAAA